MVGSQLCHWQAHPSVPHFICGGVEEASLVMEQHCCPLQDSQMPFFYPVAWLHSSKCIQMLSVCGNAAYHDKGKLKWGSRATGRLKMLGEVSHQGGGLQ